MRIAHLSDLHVLRLDGVGPHRFLNKRLTGYANIRLKRGHTHHARYVRAIAREIVRAGVDHVAITGDITNLALDEEFAAAREILEADLGLSPSQVSIVPGNHDLYTGGAMRGRRFAKYFAEYLESDVADAAAAGGLGAFPFVKLRGPCAIVGLSSAVPRPPLVAAGEVGHAQLERLERILSHPDVKERTLVLLLHHPAHNPPSRIKTLLEGLYDAEHLARSLQPVARGLVLHGHLHRRQQRPLVTRRGSLHVVGATSASLHHEHAARMAGFNLYEIDDDGRIAHIEAHVLDPDNDAFSVADVPLVS